MSEDWHDPSAEARRQRREQAQSQLTSLQIPHRTSNNYAHVIITYPQYTIDFWPGPGTWKGRTLKPQVGPTFGKGLEQLINHLRKKGLLTQESS